VDHISAIILTAGKSERMGRPKALLEIRGRTFLENILEAIRQSDVQDTVVVVGHHRHEIETALRIDNVVFNPDYEQGMITSIQTGICALPGSTDGALLFLVDHPVVNTTTINTLIAKFEPDRVVLPTFENRRGHPVLFARKILDEILDLPASSGANAVVRKDPTRIVEVRVNDPGVLIDIDTPDQYAEYLRS
jgi:molybdenum cofactor cytidylyltransferase